MQRRLAAILHADVAGFSRLMADDEQRTLCALKSGLDLMGESIARHQGRICNTAGDAVLAEFSSVNAAIACAVETQKQLARQNEDTPEDQRLQLRIGINLGEVLAEDDGQVYGNGVNVAARLQSLAEPGTITVSGRAREQVDGTAPIQFVPMGRHRVKNIPKPVRVYRVISGTPSETTLRGRRYKRSIIAVAAMIFGLAVIIGLGLWLRDPSIFPAISRNESLDVPASQPRLAVLPFRNASGDADEDYFADAVTENLRIELGRFAEIGVIAGEALDRPSDAQMTPKKLREALGATYLLAGAVRRDGETLRLTARLIDTEKGLQVWSQQYDRPITDLFGVQDEIVRSVAGEAMVSLGRKESDRVFGKSLPDLEAYDLFVRGRALVARETREDNIKARELFREAIQKDSGFALAYVGLASTYYREATRGWSQFVARNVSEAEHLARRASQLDPTLAEAYEMLGRVSLLRGNYEQAEAELRQSVSLNPNSLGALQALGNVLTFLGDVEQAVQSMKKAISLGASPSSRSLPILGLAYILQNKPEEAIRTLETYARDRRDHFYYATLAIAYSELGNSIQAAAAASETQRAWPYFNAEEFARQFRDSQQQQRILGDLRKAGLP